METTGVLFAIFSFFEVDQDAQGKQIWFPCEYHERTIFNICGRTTKPRRMPDDSEEGFGGHGVPAVYNNEFAVCGMALKFSRAPFERYH